MTITQAQYKITQHLNSGLISTEEARKLSQLIRRTSGYGMKWSRKHQEKMRNAVMSNFN